MGIDGVMNLRLGFWACHRRAITGDAFLLEVYGEVRFFPSVRFLHLLTSLLPE